MLGAKGLSVLFALLVSSAHARQSDETPPSPVVRLGAPTAAAPVEQVQAQNKDEPKKLAPDADKDAAIRITTKPPSHEELFHFETEAQLRERLLKEAKQAGVQLLMTEYTTPSRVPLPLQRGLPAQTSTYASSRLCYGRLFFEQIETERYGDERHGVQALASTGRFYFDLGLWPLRLATVPWRPVECNDDDTGFVWDRVASPRYPWWLW